jgi:hypothetical protein
MLLSLSSLAVLPAPQPSLQLRAVPALRSAQLFMQQELSREKVLVSLDTLSATYRDLIDTALEERNRERMLAGQPAYRDVEDMIVAYQKFEGDAKGMSRAEAEDEVLRYLQKQATLEEGTYNGDPQEVLTFALMFALVAGLGYNFVVVGLPAMFLSRAAGAPACILHHASAIPVRCVVPSGASAQNWSHVSVLWSMWNLCHCANVSLCRPSTLACRVCHAVHAATHAYTDYCSYILYILCFLLFFALCHRVISYLVAWSGVK